MTAAVQAARGPRRRKVAGSRPRLRGLRGGDRGGRCDHGGESTPPGLVLPTAAPGGLDTGARRSPAGRRAGGGGSAPTIVDVGRADVDPPGRAARRDRGAPKTLTAGSALGRHGELAAGAGGVCVSVDTIGAESPRAGSCRPGRGGNGQRDPLKQADWMTRGMLRLGSSVGIRGRAGAPESPTWSLHWRGAQAADPLVRRKGRCLTAERGRRT